MNRDAPLFRSMTKYSLFALAVILLGGILLSLQLPYAYYAEDSVFHSAKLLAAADHEYFTEAVTGYEIPYPSLFYVINGNIMRMLHLGTFGMDRLLQLFTFVGYFMAGWFFLATIVEDRRLAALGALCMVFLLFAPTGKYFLIQNPSNFSIPFMLAGLGFLMRYVRDMRLRSGIAGTLIIAIAVDIWWWNILPVIGIALGIIYILYRSRELKPRINQIIVCVGLFAVVLCYNLLALYLISDSLSLQAHLLTRHSLANSQSILELIRIWAVTLLTKGNEQFSQYLVPGALNSQSTALLVYGILASVYFYLIVIPFNLLMAIGSCAHTLKKKYHNRNLVLLLIASGIVAIASFAIQFSFNISVMRRVQVYAYIFLLPGFLIFLGKQLSPVWMKRITAVLTSVAALAVLYTSVYSDGLVLSRPTTAATDEVIRRIEQMPPDSRRVFMPYLDVNILARYVRFRSFQIWPRRHFHIDPVHWDSLETAYESILSLDPHWREWTDYYRTRNAIIAKYEIHKYPITRVPRDNGPGSLLQAFRDSTQVVFENDDWVIFDLTGPPKDSAALDSPIPAQTLSAGATR